MSTDLSKQDYLKRYLEGDDQDKKRKKKVKTSKSIIPRIKIFDQDISIKSLKFGTKEEVDEDESPVIAEIIDDRPVEIKSKEIYQASRWKRIGEDDSENSTVNVNSITTSQNTLQKPKKNNHSQNSVRRHDSDSDLSPLRVTRRHDSDSDCSPPRRQTNVPKETKKLNSNSRSSKDYLNKSRSPSHSRCLGMSQKNNSDSDLSPERPGRQKSDSDLSPDRPRKRRSPVPEDNDSDLSPPRKNTHSSSRGNSPSKDKKQRPNKTLSGLKAGLQNATTLKEETKELRQREKKQIKELDADLSGRNADTVVRDRQTGRRRDIDEELRVTEEKEKKNQEQQLKYAEWGKGIEQTENKKQKISEDLYEMSKPLARYCDDEDLDQQLKAEIHDEDPMAQYMRKKKQKAAPSVYPMYTGPPPPPNRFQITPGYRWDGVDRSNGFEKRYFEQKSTKKAAAEEAYLWSVQEM